MPEFTQILAAIERGEPQAAEQLLPVVYDELRKLAAARLAHEKPGQTLSATALVHEAWLRLVGGGGRQQGTGDRQQVTGDRQQVTGDRQQGAGNSEPGAQPPVSCSLSPVSSPLSPVSSPLSPVSCSLSPVSSPLSPVSSPLSPVSFDSRGHFFAAAAEAMRRILINRARDKQRSKRGGARRRVDLDSIEVALDTPAEDLLALDEALELLAAEDKLSADLVKLRFFAGLTQGEAAQSLGIPRRTADRHWAYARAWLSRHLRDDH